MTTTLVPPRLTLAPLAGRYDAILCDVWGVVHNGVAAWPAACAALARYRAGGGTVVLVSNAPRPSASVVPQLDRLGAPREAWDRFVTSGDITVRELERRGISRLFHIGPPRDLSIFAALPLKLTPVEEAEIAVVTGLDDDEADAAEDYRERLEAVRARGLTLICANPDRVVERGHRLIPCAGAVADIYIELGGEVVFGGKPYPPIYEAALELAAEARREPIDRARVLAIGDAVRTDLAGANTMGLDCLFVTGGIHAGELGDAPDADAFARTLGGERPPIGWTKRLSWD